MIWVDSPVHCELACYEKMTDLPFLLQESELMPNPPDWITELADGVARLMTSPDMMSPVGCHFAKDGEVCEITLFAARTEVYGGELDGRTRDSAFFVDIMQLACLFDRIESIEWQALPVNDSDEIGSHLAVTGIFQTNQVHLRLCARSPARFETGRYAHVQDGCWIDTW